MTNPLFDYTVIGGGIVGIATALSLKQQQPECSVLVMDKEEELARHQTGHNSGVIHAGVYYQPGSLKATFCKRGARATMEFCRRHDIPWQQPGKLLVATNDVEYRRMLELRERCGRNGIEVETLDRPQLQQLEPHIEGVAALRVAGSGIVDYRRVTEVMAQEFQALGGDLRNCCELIDARESCDRVTLCTSSGEIDTRVALACAGLMADRVCDLFDLRRDFAILPFRGEYYQLPESKRSWVRHLIYPIPDPAMPFLGVHLTPMIDGRLSVGPNAVLGWKREGYKARGNFSLRDSIGILGFSGFWRLAANHFGSALEELGNSWWKPRYLKQVQKYCPSITLQDLAPYPTGIRAQAVRASGELVQDFLFAESRRSLHVCNAPSPAATSAIPIGEHIAKLARSKLQAL